MKNIIVKSFVLFFVTAMLATAVTAGAAPIRTTPKGATVTGFVELTGENDLPIELQDIFKGPDTTYLGTKTILVKGTYKAGAEFITVEGVEDVSSSMPKYWFNLPIPPKVSTYLIGGFSRKNTVAVLAYASQDAIHGTGVADNQSLEKLFKEKIVGGKKRTFAKEFKKQLKSLAIKKFRAGQIASIVDVGALMSVNKVTATKSSTNRPTKMRNKAKVTGPLTLPNTKSKGRFQLDMVFDL